MDMPQDPLKALEELDPEFHKAVRNTAEFALADGALPRKVKLLIALALDASHGAVGGVTALTRAATHAGASKQEIAEALRVAWYISGAGGAYTAARGLGDAL
jgi:alkylhydroperoxidase/carboxymuconolactone decarboxylase family protein YurZ